jgi:hypothetical protein
MISLLKKPHNMVRLELAEQLEIENIQEFNQR